MSVEIIKAKHLPFSIFLMGLAYFAFRFAFSFMQTEISNLNSAITFYAIFFLIMLPSLGVQYLENKFIWSKVLNLQDRFSFMGLSMGAGIGILSVILW